MSSTQSSSGHKRIFQAPGSARRRKCGRRCGRCGDRRFQGRRLVFEPLEDRRLLAWRVWDGDGADGLWSNPANWLGGVVPSANDDLIFRQAALTQTDNDLAAGTVFRSLWFLADDYSVSGNALGVSQRIMVGPGASGASIAADVSLEGSVHATVVGGPLWLSGELSGSGSLDVNGNGVVELANTAGYTGNTTIHDDATVRLGSLDSLPSGPGAGTVTVDGSLDLGGWSATLNGLAGSGLITSSAPRPVTLTVDTTGQSSTFSGVIEDGVARVDLTTTGTGTFTLSGANTFTGVVTIEAGSTLRVGGPDALSGDPEVNGTLDLAGYDTTLDGLWGTGTITSSVSGSVTLSVDASNYWGTFSGVIEDGSGTMAVAIIGTGRQTFAGANTYSGGTTIEPYATLRVAGTQGTLGSGDVTADDGYGGYGGPAELVFDRDAGLTVGNDITGSLHVDQQGSGTIVLSGTNSYTGGTTVASGKTLKVGSNSGLGDGGTATVNGTLDLNGYSPSVAGLAGSGTITSGVSGTAALTVNPAEDSTFSGVIQDGSGTVSLVKSGSATLYLTGNNTYSGGTTICGGTLYVGYWTASGTLGSGPVTNYGTLAFLRTGSATIGTAISGSGSLVVEYGTVTLTGANTYSGGTTIYPYATLRVGGTQGTLGSGDVTADDGYGGYGGLAELVFDRDIGLTVGNNITGSLHVRQQGSGPIVLTGTNTYSGGTTVAAGSTLRVGNDGTAGTVGPGEIVIEQDAELAFDRSDSFTLENTLSGSGVLNQDGSGTLVFTGAGSVGGVTIGSGTIRVEGSLTSDAPLVNEGTLRVVGAGAFTHAGRRIAGSAAALSAGEVFLTSTGLGSPSVSFDFEISTDGANWYPIAEGGAADSQTMLSGLGPETEYYLRGRVAHPGGGQEIYDGGMVSTGLRPGPGVPDTSGWYRIVRITSDADGSRLVPEDPSTAYVDRRVLPQATDEVLRAVDAQVHVFGDPGTPPPGSDFIFNLDRSWFFAGSPQAAVLQSLVGLVTDGTAPTVTKGLIKLWHVWHVAEGQTLYDLWTFDEGRYPDGGYSGVYHYEESFTVELEELQTSTSCQTDECCDDTAGGAAAPSILDGTGVACGAPTNTGGAMMAMPAIHHTGGASACTGVGGGLTYASRETSLDTGFGPGWSDADELPYLSGGSQNVMVRLGSEQSVWFDALPGGAYAARYGAKDTLLHDAVNHLFIFTRPNGTRGEFFDFDQTDRPQGGLYRLVQPGGATIEVTGWTEEGIDGRIAEVLDKITPAGQAHQKRAFTYVATDDGREHVQTLTLLAYDQAASSWIDVRRLSYAYYAADADYGLPGDLKKIVTQQWDADGEQWIGDDTNYFRYYTAAGTAHELKRVLIPNAYAVFVSTYGDPDDPQNLNAGDGQSDPISNYTCFYYEYDADHRVTSRLVFGKSNETDYTVTLSRNSRQTNYWHRKTVETRPDGSTHTMYSNHLGQLILTDLYDPAEQVHVITYNRYDGDGRLLLAVESSPFVFYGGGYYDEDLPDLVGFATGDSPYLSDTDGLFHVSTYYESTTQGIDEETAGGVEGFRYQTAVAHGEDAARLAPGAQDGPILLSSWTYYARAAGGAAIYPLTASTVYANEDGSGAIATTYAYTWYADSFQVQQQTTTLPAVSTEQNGSGQAVSRKQWFDTQGQLAWTMDELGRVTWYGYDSLTGRMTRSIEDIDDDAADQLQLTPPAGWTLPGSGANRITDYQYDPFGRLTQMLGPAHTALVEGAPAEVRTASWTFYNDAAHQTRSAQGYAEYNSQSGQWDLFTILGPVSITKTDRDGRTTERIQAVYSGTVAGLASAAIPQSDYTAWTTNQYSKTRPASQRVYHDIPASGNGSVGVNYLQTTYGYETFGTGKLGRQNRTVTADGTITRVVFDARGNVLETWIGTDDTGATDADSTGGAAQGNNMLLVSSAAFDIAGNLLESRAHFDSGANDYYATLYQYDWRNRRTGVLAPGDVVTQLEYDNLGRQLWTKTYASADFTLFAAELRAQSQKLYDPRGRVYESRLYAVDPADGTVGAYLPSYTWYDARGRVVKTATANGLFHKYQYDGPGRVVATYTSFDLDEEDYADALDVTGDTVIEQTRAWYDPAGQTVATATYRRLPDDTTTTGALSAATSYATAALIWYDGLGRTVATADYGREDVGSGLTHYFFDGTTGALIDADENGIPDIAEAAPPEPYPQDPDSERGHGAMPPINPSQRWNSRRVQRIQRGNNVPTRLVTSHCLTSDPIVHSPASPVADRALHFNSLYSSCHPRFNASAPPVS